MWLKIGFTLSVTAVSLYITNFDFFCFFFRYARFGVTRWPGRSASMTREFYDSNASRILSIERNTQFTHQQQKATANLGGKSQSTKSIWKKKWISQWFNRTVKAIPNAFRFFVKAAIRAHWKPIIHSEWFIIQSFCDFVVVFCLRVCVYHGWWLQRWIENSWSILSIKWITFRQTATW